MDAYNANTLPTGNQARDNTEQARKTPESPRADACRQKSHTASVAAKQQRNRLSKKDTEEMYGQFIALLHHGCSLAAIKLALSLDKKKVGMFASIAVERHAILNKVKDQLVVCESELPATLSPLETDGMSFFVFTFEADRASGHFKTVSAAELIEMACQTANG